MKWAEEIMDFVAQMIDFVLQLMNLFAQNTYDKPWSFYLGIYGCCFALGTPQHAKMVAFVLNMMDFVLKMFDFVLKMFDFVLQMFVLRVRPAGRLPWLADREHSLRKTHEMRLPLKTICFPEEILRCESKTPRFSIENMSLSYRICVALSRRGCCTRTSSRSDFNWFNWFRSIVIDFWAVSDWFLGLSLCLINCRRLWMPTLASLWPTPLVGCSTDSAVILTW